LPLRRTQTTVVERIFWVGRVLTELFKDMRANYRLYSGERRQVFYPWLLPPVLYWSSTST